MMSSKNCPICIEPFIEKAESCTLQENVNASSNVAQIQSAKLILKYISTAGEDTLTKKTSKGVHLVFFFFKQTSVVYIGGKVNYCSCNFLMWLLKYWRIVSRKPSAFSEKVKKKLKELQFKLDLVFLAKVLHFVSTQQYLQWSLKDFEVNSNFLIKFAKLLFQMQKYLKNYLNDKTLKCQNISSRLK